MSNNEMPEELVKVSYIRLGETYAVRFTIHGIEQGLVIVPRIESSDFVSSVFKTIMVISDPVGPCINEEPY